MDYLCYLLKVIKTYHFNPSQINVMSIIRLFTVSHQLYVIHALRFMYSINLNTLVVYQSQKCLETCFEEKNIASALLGNVMKHKAKRIEIQDHKYDFKVT